MKIKSDKWQVTSDKRRTSVRGKSFFTCHSPLITRHSERGIALVITLILLSVTLVMALAFLAISRRESSSVTTAGETAAARLAADSALANAQAQAMATILTNNNPYNFGLIVSTNYINPLGGNSSADPTNVNYDNAGANWQQNIANLLYSPRPPVFVTTNQQTGSNDFRFYLDLNRNGTNDANGNQPVIGPNGGFMHPDGTENNNPVNVVTNFEVGDPEWIGVLEHPDAPHGPNNKFIARYAFIAQPVGNALDLNAIHNQAITRQVDSSPANFNTDGFFRNQGVGSWEINLAAFLADLNTNQWGQAVGSYPNFQTGSANWYQYNQANPSPSPNLGLAFQDALSLLSYRYNYAYNSLASANNLFQNAANVFPNDGIDAYSDGPLQTTPDTNADFFANDNPTLPWAGADNTNHFFTPSDLFDPTKSSGGATGGFTNRLLNAGNSVSTYDRYTFYRLLSQLGVDSAPETGRMNLNYDNLDVDPATGTASGTNFMAWTPLGFFTNAADRMLRAYTGRWRDANTANFTATFSTNEPFGVTDIPVLVSNRFVYTPAVQRVLQLAANIHDATTTNFYPSVFRPLFTAVQNGINRDVFISGYTNMINTFIQSGFETNAVTTPDLVLPVEVTALPVGQDMLTNVYGVPWIIGAKKGLPNFNKFSLESAFQITRKLQFTANTNTTPWQYASNQMYFMSITNYGGVQCWNSYRLNYPGTVTILTRLSMQMSLTNDASPTPLNFVNGTNVWSLLTTNIWPGYNSSFNNGFASFKFPIGTNFFFPFLSSSNGAAVYYYGNSIPANNSSFPPAFLSPTGPTTNYLDKGTPPLPHFVLLMTNRLQVAIIDYSAGLNNGQIVDYVQLNGMDATNDLNTEINFHNNNNDNNSLWNTNLPADGNGMTLGVQNQIATSKNGSGDPAIWAQATPVPGLPNKIRGTVQVESQYFSKFFGSSFNNTIVVGGTNVPVTYTSASLQAPYTPSLTRVQRYTWQANDPLVHYLTSDLIDTANDPNPQFVADWPWNLTQPNERYMPWNIGVANLSAYKTNMMIKDSLVYSSTNWDFPTNKFPTVGWIGRVHRGTPWQTVYLKSTDLTNAADWQTWTGDGNQYDALNAAPVQDRLLFDVFTAAFNDNATRGQLSVNVAASPNNNDPAAGLAAWSALFSGVVVPTNTIGGYAVIQPAGTYDAASALTNPLVQIVAGINSARTNTALFPNKVFTHTGDILAAPQLMEQLLPLLGVTNAQVSDEMYEWLPQQVMSLLRVGSSPRYVIYSYGQALKPAPKGVYLGTTPAGMFGMVTNYQVVSEVATRAVVRVNTLMTTNTGVIPNTVTTNYSTTIEQFNILPPD